MIERKKGQSLLELPFDYTVIDIETTGYDQRYDNIIEVGCIKYRNGEEVSRYQSLIKPPKNSRGNYVDEFIELRTGITNEMLESAPVFDEVAMPLWKFLKKELLVGHNVNFDINFLYDIFIDFNSTWILRNNFVDTLRLSRRALPELKHHRLEDLDNYFDIGIAHHRSIFDCETTNIVLKNLVTIIEREKVDLSPPKRQREYISRQKIDLRTLKSDTTELRIESPFYNKVCVFTGTLSKYSRVEAGQIVVNLGGICANGVTKKTNLLIVGDFDYSSNIKGGKSSKLKRAEQLISEGQDLQIISESVFYDMLSDFEI